MRRCAPASTNRSTPATHSAAVPTMASSSAACLSIGPEVGRAIDSGLAHRPRVQPGVDPMRHGLGQRRSRRSVLADSQPRVDDDLRWAMPGARRACAVSCLACAMNFGPQPSGRSSPSALRPASAMPWGPVVPTRIDGGDIWRSLECDRGELDPRAGRVDRLAGEQHPDRGDDLAEGRQRASAGRASIWVIQDSTP